MKCIVRWISLFNKVIALYGAGAVLFALVFVTALNVVLRYAFNSPFQFIIELDENLLLIMAFLIGGYTMLLDGHVRVDVVFDRLSEKQKAIQEIITYPLVLIYFLVIVWFGSAMTFEAWEIKTTSAGMGWLLWPVYVFVPIGGILLCLQTLANFHNALMRLIKGSDES